MEEKKEEELKQEAVVVPPAGKTPEEIAAEAIAIAEATATKLQQAESDRDNYRDGMLAKDRKLKELKDLGYDTSEAEKGLSAEDVSRLLDEKLAQFSKPKEEEVGSLHKTISELKTALVNRQGLPDKPAGGSTEGTPDPKPTRWVDDPATKASLEARGLNPDSVYNNWKANQPN